MRAMMIRNANLNARGTPNGTVAMLAIAEPTSISAGAITTFTQSITPVTLPFWARMFSG
jgi:hypothetical protein